MKILDLIWQGVWTGVGVELSLFTLWIVWRVAHSKYIHKLDPEHWLHNLAEYFE